MQQNEVCRVDVIQELALQQIINSFYYQQTSSASTSLIDLLNAFKTAIVDTMKAIQSSLLLYRALKGVNLNNTAEIAEMSLTDVGGVVGGTNANTAPVFAAYGILLRRGTGATRNGAKRVAGVPEANLNADQIIGSVTGMSTFLAALDDNLGWNVVNIARPVIIGRLPNGGYDLTKINPVVSAQAQRYTTQNTRKVGRGK